MEIKKNKKTEKRKLVSLQVKEMKQIEGGNRWTIIYGISSMLVGPVGGAIFTLGVYNGYHDTK